MSKPYKVKFLKATTLMLTVAALYPAASNAEIVLEHGASVKAGTKYHSNLQFVNDKQKESVYVYSLVPEYKLTALDDKNKWFGTLGILLSRSSNKLILNNREDPFAQAGWTHTFENSELELQADYVKRSSRITQFTETGALAADGSSTAKSVQGVWTLAIAPKWDLKSSAKYLENKFSGVSVLSDFVTKDVGVELKYKLNERWNPYGRVLATDYKATGATGSAHVRYQAYLAGAEVAMSPSFSFDVNTGLVQFNSSGKDEWVGSFAATYLGNFYEVTGSIRREVFPTGLNIVQVGDALDTNYTYFLSDRSTLGARIGLSQNDASYKTQLFTGSYNRNLSAAWLMEVEMGFRNVKTEGLESADDATLGIFFTYTSPKF